MQERKKHFRQMFQASLMKFIGQNQTPMLPKVIKDPKQQFQTFVTTLKRESSISGYQET